MGRSNGLVEQAQRFRLTPFSFFFRLPLLPQSAVLLVRVHSGRAQVHLTKRIPLRFHALLLESHVLSSPVLYDALADFCPQQRFSLFRSHPALGLKREKSDSLPLNGAPWRFHDKARRRRVWREISSQRNAGSAALLSGGLGVALYTERGAAWAGVMDADLGTLRDATVCSDRA